MKKVLITLLIISMAFNPLIAGGSQEETSKIVGGTSGAVVGGVAGVATGLAAAAAGAAKGAAAGAAAGSVVPGIGTGIGAIVGAGVGIIGGGLAGFGIGSAIGNATSNIETEYINVVTKFSYSQSGSDRIETITYGAEGTEDAGQYFVPDFNIGQDVILNIEMTPSLTESAYYVKDELKSDRVRIPVQITISNATNITVTKDSGVGGNVTPEYDVQGNAIYSFDIANENAPKTVRFRFTPSGEDRATIEVKYGDSEKPITTKDSNIFATIRFKEM